MTADRARKRKIRARMAERSETFSVAAQAVEEEQASAATAATGSNLTSEASRVEMCRDADTTS